MGADTCLSAIDLSILDNEEAPGLLCIKGGKGPSGSMGAGAPGRMPAALFTALMNH
ncbi:hypothetical protein DSCW_02710 [Desulfosarcina widdelii]|uniref:Uncharacterized protein n=1 Tax=Desulfosarcina widdelii TaxID=947919 RepID=A0A5K7Z327_9BACT|nr:hypothetical protein DSCW_02710 [Desulfosarcina widdelii]